MRKLLQSKTVTHGFSLIELMVAMLVGLLLIGGTASVYLASKRSYLEVEMMARMTQNGRFALQVLSESIIHAGYAGETQMGIIERDIDLSDPTNDCDDIAETYDIEHYLVATTPTSASVFGGCITDAMPNSSVLVIKNVRPMKFSDTDGNDSIDSPQGILATNTYVMTNNARGIMFHGSDKSPPSIAVGGEVPGGSAWIYQMHIYYISDNGNGTPQLTRKVLGNNTLVTESLVEGVENMSFLFGLDTNGDGDIDTYSTVNDMPATLWNEISSIQVNFLVRSETADPNHINSTVYHLGGLGANIGPLNDNFHRMVMQTTVSLRNPNFVIRGNL